MVLHSKVQKIMSLNDVASSLLWRTLNSVLGWSSRIDPLWLLPMWLKNIIVYTASCALFLGSGVAALLYFNQVSFFQILDRTCGKIV